MTKNKLYSFIFRGLLCEEALDKAGRRPKSNFSVEWELEMSKRLGIHLMDEDFVFKSHKMSIVYTAISTFENSVREFIEKKFLDEQIENWWGKKVKKEIRTKAETRKASENDVRWLTARGESPIHYTDFGDLISIMAGNWDLFEVHIKNIDWAKQIISTLEKSRNIIMHSGELSQADVERVGMYIRDWISQVG